MAARIPEITSVKVTGHYQLHVGFSDGAEGDVDVSDLQDAGGVFEPLRDPAFFAKAFVDSGAGTVAWPNGADLAPEGLHAELVSAEDSHWPGLIAGLAVIAAAVGTAIAVGAKAAARGLTRV